MNPIDLPRTVELPMPAHLYPREDDAEYISPKEVVSRLAQSMPTTLIDWVRGNEIATQMLNELIAMNAPNVILQSHRSLLMETVYVEVSFPAFADKRVHFVVQPYGRIVLESNVPEDADFMAYAARELSSSLGYDFEVATSED